MEAHEIQIMNENEKEGIDEKEFEKRMAIANTIINEYLRIYIDFDAIIREKLLSDLDDRYSVEQRLSVIEEELKLKRLDYVKRVIESLFGKAYIDSGGMSFEELIKLYKETGFDDLMGDESVHLGFVKLRNAYAFIYTFSEPYEAKWEIEFMIREKQ